MPEQAFRIAENLAPAQPNMECRVHTRLSCELTATCQPVAAYGRKDSRWSAIISDISLGGIRLIVRRRFEKDAGLGIELPARNGEEPSIVLAKVIHVRALPDGSWALGCKFISELSDDEVQRLLPAPPPSAAAPEPVEAMQAPLAPSQHLQAVSTKDAAEKKRIADVSLQLEVPGRIINCRIQRLAVPGVWPLAAGKTLAIQTHTPNSRLPLLRLKVVRCWLEEGRWILRCQLLNPLTDELLQAILRPASPRAVRT